MNEKLRLRISHGSRRLLVGGGDLFGGLFAPLRILPEEFETVAVRIEEIDALVPAPSVAFEIVDRGLLLLQAIMQMIEGLGAPLEFHREMIESAPLAVMLM